jgi:hypothetical protein
VPAKPFLIFAVMWFAAAPPAAHAAAVALVAYLSGASAVPPSQSAAFGEADFTYDSETKELDYLVTYEGMPSAQVEIHGPADATENAPTLIPFPSPQTPLSGILVLSSRQADLLLAGKLYVEAHATGFAGGAIRGQIEKRQ